MEVEERSALGRGIVLLIVAFLIATLAAREFLKQYIPEPIVKGPGVTKIVKLSDYFDGLKNTYGDTDVYILEGEKPGGVMMVLGGTHPVEPAGQLAPILLIENAKVSQGKLILIPRANNSGFTDTEPGQGYPERFHIKTKFGTRWFRFSDRSTNPAHQWPDPDVFYHYPSKQGLAGPEIRNLNRNHPGRPNGYLTEKIGYGITQLIKKESVDISVDLHEAPPDRPLVLAIAAHQRALKLSATAAFNAELNHGIKIRLEASPPKFHGFSHREWGDHTPTLALLMEALSPMHGPIRGRATEELILTAKDEFEVRAAKMGRLFAPYDEKGLPLDVRTARHVTMLLELANAYSEMNPARAIKIENVPTYEMMVKNGIGEYLLPVP